MMATVQTITVKTIDNAMVSSVDSEGFEFGR